MSSLAVYPKTEVRTISRGRHLKRPVATVDQIQAIVEEWRQEQKEERHWPAWSLSNHWWTEKELAPIAIAQRWTRADLIAHLDTRLEQYLLERRRKSAVKNLCRAMFVTGNWLDRVDEAEEARLGDLALDFFKYNRAKNTELADQIWKTFRKSVIEWQKIHDEWLESLYRKGDISQIVQEKVFPGWRWLDFEKQQSILGRIYPLDPALEDGQAVDLAPFEDIPWILDYVATRKAQFERERAEQENNRQFMTWWNGLSEDRRMIIEKHTTLNQRYEWIYNPKRRVWDSGEWIADLDLSYGEIIKTLHAFFSTTSGLGVPESVRVVFLDYLDLLNRSGLWVVPYSYRYAAKRTGYSEKICMRAVQKLRKMGFLLWEGGGQGSIQIDENGFVHGEDPARYSLGQKALNQASDQVGRWPNNLRSTLPSNLERALWKRLGSTPRLVFYTLMDGPGTVSEIVQRTGKTRNTVSTAIKTLKREKLVYQQWKQWRANPLAID